jgi:hypothetical protein
MKLKSLLDYAGNHQVAPMSKEDSEIFIRLTLMEQEQGSGENDGPPDMLKVLSEDFACKVVKGRLGLAKVTVSPYAMMWVSIMSKGSPGNAVLWAYTLCHMAEKANKTHVVFGDMAYAFPFGFPIEDSMRECWEAQKQAGAPLSNAMDATENWVLGAEPEVAEA